MPAAALAQPLALSTPKTNAQLPFPMFVNGTEISSVGATATSIRVRDPGFGGNAELSITIEDHTNAIVSWIAKQQRVIWYDAANARYLFQGFVSGLRIRPVATWAEIDVTVTHLSSVLDYARPVGTWSGGGGASDQTTIQALLALYSQEPNVGCGGYVQVLNASLPNSPRAQRTTLRNVIDQVLATTGVKGAVAYLDNLGYLHTMAVGDLSAPYDITDASPPWTTAVPGVIEVEDEGAPDVDALYVYGSTPAATGPVYAWQCGITQAPRQPLRWAVLDAPEAVDAATQLNAATVEFQRRQNALRVRITVTGYDGWAKGQLVRVTNRILGWTAKAFTINAVDMEVISGKGDRRYVLTVGSDPVLFTARIRYAHAQWKFLAAGNAALRGNIGGPLKTAG